MKDYTKAICSEFMTRYPDSAAYRGGRKLRLGGWESRYPETAHSLEAKEAFLESVEELCSRGIFSAGWKRFRDGDVLEALYLEDPEGLYRYSELPHPDRIRKTILEAVGSYVPGSDLSGQLKTGIQNLLSEKKRLATGNVENPEDAVAILKLADVSPDEINTSTIRQLSIRLFSNSKRIEQILPLADKISTAVRGEGLSETLNISRSYPETSFCLHGKLHFAGGMHWKLDGRSITLPLPTVQTVSGFSWQGEPPAILLLENKESYHTAVNRFQDTENVSGFSGFLYLGGYPNRADAQIIRLLEDSGAQLSCFCDLDPAGLLIVQKVEEILETPPALWKMDTATFEAYSRYGYPLLESELKKLSLLTDSRLFQLKAILEKIRMGIEQEIIGI